MRDEPKFRDLRGFLARLEGAGDLARIAAPVGLVHETTEIADRVLRRAGPALVFEATHDGAGRRSAMPMVANLFGTPARVAAGLGDALARWPMLKAGLATRPVAVRRPPCQDETLTGAAVDLARLPVPTAWPGEPAPLITWPLVITRPYGSQATETPRLNTSVYRMQVAGRDRAILRWLAHRGGAAHHRGWKAAGADMPVAVAIGADPATILAAALPLPETVSELAFNGVLRGERPRLAPAATVPMLVPADAEIVIEGWASATETPPEGPYGDHTGYYNAVEPFPAMRVTAITHRRDPLYLTTHTGRPPDEPSVIGGVFNALALPVVRGRFPEVVGLHFPPEACSYRIAVAAIDKRYPGQARRVMLGLWGLLPQLSYTKAIVVVDADIDPTSFADVAWALATRCDPARDLLVIADTPIDHLDFASPEPGLGGKLGIDATTKIGTETRREWGRPLFMSADVKAAVDRLWPRLGLDGGGGR